MAEYKDVTESIVALKAESAQDAVTPERVGNLLQAIVDLIKALSMVPEQEVVDIMQAVNNALSTAQAANGAAASALTAANGKRITQFKADAAATEVTITVKQSAHVALTISLPLADASQAGIVLPKTLQDIQNAADAAANGKLANITLNYVSGISLAFKAADGSILATKTIPLATTTHHGLLSAVDKAKLDALPDGGFVSLDQAGRVPAAQAPQIMLRSISDTLLDDLRTGEFYFADGKIWYKQSDTEEIDMGVPSKNVIYCHTDTDILYRWTGSTFTPVATDPNYAMQKVEVRRANATLKNYVVPNGVLAIMILTTDPANITLTPATSGASVHRMIFYAQNLGSCTIINWPDGLIWKDNIVPVAQDVDSCEGLMVTVYDNKFAEFKAYGR